MKTVVLNNIRSAHNVGSILRTAEFFGYEAVYFVGVTPHPTLPSDTRLPHIRAKLDKQISKVSLGAEHNLKLSYFAELGDLISELKSQGVQIIALEQDPAAVSLSAANPSQDFALVLGEETKGFTKQELGLADIIVEIPRVGQKESLNVSVAFGIAAAQLGI